jgi:hypothetical protein
MGSIGGFAYEMICYAMMGSGRMMTTEVNILV